MLLLKVSYWKGWFGMKLKYLNTCALTVLCNNATNREFLSELDRVLFVDVSLDLRFRFPSMTVDGFHFRLDMARQSVWRLRKLMKYVQSCNINLITSATSWYESHFQCRNPMNRVIRFMQSYEYIFKCAMIHRYYDLYFNLFQVLNVVSHIPM